MLTQWESISHSPKQVLKHEYYKTKHRHGQTLPHIREDGRGSRLWLLCYPKLVFTSIGQRIYERHRHKRVFKRDLK